MASEYKLSVTPVKVTELPDGASLLAQGREILASTASWKPGKTFFKNVRTFSRPKGPGDNAGWHSRTSEHEGSFDEFWNLLGVDKGLNEMHYVHEVKKATLIREVAPGQTVWSMFYRFPPPVTPRVFTVLQVIELSQSSPREGMIVSIPVDLSPEPGLLGLEEKGVRGQYSSVELIKELGDGKIEWRMATTSRPNGHIPQFIAERAMPKSVAQDVPGLLKLIHEIRGKPAAETKPQGDHGAPEPVAAA